MNASLAAATYLTDNKAAAPIAVTTWATKTLTRRAQREVPTWTITAELDALVAEGKAVKVESVMGATAYLAN